MKIKPIAAFLFGSITAKLTSSIQPSLFIFVQILTHMKLRSFLLVAAAPLLLYSCVSSKKFKTAQTDIAKLQDKYSALQADNDTCGQEKGLLSRQKETLEREKALLTARLKELQDQR